MEKFGPNDLFVNTLKTFPKQEFWIYEANVFLNNKGLEVGFFTSSVPGMPTGYVSLDEYNVDRNSGSTGEIYPFITKGGSGNFPKTVSVDSYGNDFGFGDILTGSSPSSSIGRYYYASGASRPHVDSLRNVLNRNVYVSPHYAYRFDLGELSWDKSTQEMSLIRIPKIFFGDAIRKGSVKLQWYVTGALAGELVDELRNGELRQSVGVNESGSVAGIVNYSNGMILLTGSWNLNDGFPPQNLLGSISNLKVPAWRYWGAGIEGDNIGPTDTTNTRLSSSFFMSFEGENPISVLTMMTKLPKAKYNYSNNPTFVAASNSSSLTPTTSSFIYREPSSLALKNTVSSSYIDPTGSFQKITYIDRVGIYDENKNLIMVANLAVPLKKREQDEYTLKLKIDLV